MMIDSIEDQDSLINLYDSLPSTASFLSSTIMRRLFALRTTRRARRLETLQSCQLALYELRDLVGIESLIPEFSAISKGIKHEIESWERPVEFRGLRHPDAGGALLKKHNNMMKMGQYAKVPFNKAKGDTAVVHKEFGLPMCADSSRPRTKAWCIHEDMELTLETFKDHLYAQNIDPCGRRV